MALGVAVGAPDGARHDHRGVRAWLAAIAVLVVAMVGVGGATRLTDSGLSITEWKPILGVIPPFSEADWQAAFAKYKQIPEYRQVNQGMSLAAFKSIYWWEWGHRFLGRFIGLAFAAGLVWFWLRRQIPDGYRVRLVALLVLGGVQGLIGWYMVQSGLTDRVDVSQYRLAMHLTMAFVILGLLVWTWADLREHREIYFGALPSGSRALALLISGLVLVQVVLGAFVAGTKAGLVYNTWPLMDGQLIPEGLFAFRPWFMSPFEDHLTVQFNHRIMAYVLIGLAAVQAVRLAGVDNDRVSGTALWLALVMVGQAGLGIWTLLAAQGEIPIGLGIAHQTFAAVVFGLSVLHLNAVRRART